MREIVDEYTEETERLDEIIELAELKKREAYDKFHEGIRAASLKKGGMELLEELIEENEKRKKANTDRMEDTEVEGKRSKRL